MRPRQLSRANIQSLPSTIDRIDRLPIIQACVHPSAEETTCGGSEAGLPHQEQRQEEDQFTAYKHTCVVHYSNVLQIFRQDHEEISFQKSIKAEEEVAHVGGGKR